MHVYVFKLCYLPEYSGYLTLDFPRFSKAQLETKGDLKIFYHENLDSLPLYVVF